MFAVRDLPTRPSVDSLRKPAKKLARDAAAENGEAIARVHVQLRGRRSPSRTGMPSSYRSHHYPANDPKRADLGWGPVTTQQVLDVALAWACLNRHFQIASFLMERGADINTNWSTHEPASILHECAIQGNEDAVRFLIEHGADLKRASKRVISSPTV